LNPPESLEALRQGYLARLPEKLQAIAAAWEDVCQSADRPAAFDGLIQALHNLAGNAGTFACPGVMGVAQRFASLLKQAEETAWMDSALFFQQGNSYRQWLEQAAVADGMQSSHAPGRSGAAKLAAGGSNNSAAPPSLLYILDSDLAFAQDLAGRLAGRGYQAQVFGQAAEYAAALQQSPPPCAAIVEMALYQVDGLPAVPVIFLSPQDDLAARLRAVRAGGQGCFSKPLDEDDLVRTLDMVCGRDVGEAYRIGIVDDDPVSTQIYRKSLEKQGMRVEVVLDPLQAITVFDRFQPEAILMDVNMPGCSGLELAVVLRQLRRYDDVPIIFLSAESDFDHQLAAVNLGGDDFLTKPITPFRLQEAVRPRVKRARTLQQSKARMQRAIQEARQLQFALDQHAIVSMADRTGNIIYANDKFCSISGYSREELLGRNHRLVKGGHPAEVYTRLWRTIAAGQVWHGKLRNRRKDGSHYWVETTIVPALDEAGLFSRYISIRTDITQLQTAQETLQKQRRLLDVLREATTRFITTADTRETAAYLLRLVLELTGSEFGFIAEVLYDGLGQPYIRTQALSNVAWDEESRRLYLQSQGYGMDFRRLDTLYGAVLTSRQPVISNDLAQDPRQGGTPQGHPQLHSFLGMPIFHGNDLVGMYAIANRPQGYDEELVAFLQPFDATCAALIDAMRYEQERQLIQAQLISAKDEAERANQAKSEFLSRMSHELRTPLNAILGFAQLLSSDPDEPLSQEQTGSVEQILTAGWHLLELINEVLELSKIEAGKLSMSWEAVSLPEVVVECRALVASLAEQRGISLYDETAACAGTLVWADRVRLKQVLLNLLSNAVKYNRQHGEVWIRCEVLEDALRISVADQGPGLSDEQLAHLFEPFNRFGAEHSNVEGTGIGLVITRGLVYAMGGSIDVASRVGEGCVFSVVLPRHALGKGDSAIDESAEAAYPDGGGAEGEAGQSLCMLYVEDNPANLKVVERILARRPQVKLLTAVDGASGIALAQIASPQLIVLDIHLPGMDGFELLSQLRSLPETADSRILALSANAMPDDVAKGLAAGFQRYLTKPVKVDEFLSIVDEALRRSALLSP
jgi:PAS domain S-box-containing protein